MELAFSGLMAPVFTAFTASGDVNVQVVPDYAKFLSDNGIRGVLVNGTSGEGMSMTVSEREQAAAAWLKHGHQQGLHVQVQVGGTNLLDVLRLAKHAEKLGADSLLCLPELFNKPGTVAELVEYLGLVAAAAPKTPLLYYHNPAYTGVALDVPSLMATARAALATFAGVKFTDTNLEMGVKCLSVAGGKQRVFLGCDYVLAGAFALGFDSAIATSLNVLPRLCARILHEAKQGSAAEARRAQDVLNQAANAITAHGKWVPAMKGAMEVVTGLDMGPARAPLATVQGQRLVDMKQSLKQLNLLP